MGLSTLEIYNPELVALAQSKGVAWRENPITTTVGLAATQILKEDRNRILWLAINMSSNNGYVWFNDRVSATLGFFVNNSGGIIELLLDEDPHLVGKEVWALNLVAPGTWTILEGTLS